MLPSQRRQCRGGRRRPSSKSRRKGWGLAGWIDGTTPKQDLSTASRAPGLHPQSRRQTKTAGHTDCIRIGWCRWPRVIVLDPIFEADLPDEQYGYRRQRSAHDAIRAVHGLVNRGHREVVDADLSGYYDTIPHHELMKCVARRVSDGAVLRLIKRGWKCPSKKRRPRAANAARRSTRTVDEAHRKGRRFRPCWAIST